MLVNYDLPWNPMIVEQRIGRVQRLASEFKHVSIFNITLRGTFEDFIVGRLMEKLQMAANAIGDIDALRKAPILAMGTRARRYVVSHVEIRSFKGDAATPGAAAGRESGNAMMITKPEAEIVAVVPE